MSQAPGPDDSLTSSGPAALKFRAFLSYSHIDRSWAQWIHRKLENFQIDKTVAGRETALGPVPPSLAPIFFDRDDFSGGAALTEATVAALDMSSALIVVCSSASGRSSAVNEEVRLFRARHPNRPAIPVIIEGEFPDNFPSALRDRLDPDGNLTDQPVTILGPDLRETGDGQRLGLAKIVAGLTGLSTDEIAKRAEHLQRRKFVTWIASLAVAALAFASLGVWAEISRQDAVARRHEADEQRKVADEQRQVAEEQRQEAIAQRQIATERATLAIDTLLIDEIPKEAGVEETQKAIEKKLHENQKQAMEKLGLTDTEIAHRKYQLLLQMVVEDKSPPYLEVRARSDRFYLMRAALKIIEKLAVTTNNPEYRKEYEDLKQKYWDEVCDAPGSQRRYPPCSPDD